MDCLRCGETVDAGAAYCGNCGAALTAVAIGVPAPQEPVAITPQLAPSEETPMAQVIAQAPLAAAAIPAATQIPAPVPAPLPAYALASPAQHKAESRSMVALVLSVLALPGSIIPIIGWALAAAAIVMATISRAKMARKTLNNMAIGFGSLAVLLSAGVYVYVLNNSQQPSPTALNSSTFSSSDDELLATSRDKATISTPCYSVNVAGMGNVDNVSSSCKAQAFNADTLSASTNAFNIEGIVQESVDAGNLAEVGQEIANTYLRTSMPDLTITSQNSGSFAGSPAYIIRGKSAGNVTIEMALVLHVVGHGENVFVLAHAINDAQASLSQFESSWAWK